MCSPRFVLITLAWYLYQHALYYCFMMDVSLHIYTHWQSIVVKITCFGLCIKLHTDYTSELFSNAFIVYSNLKIFMYNIINIHFANYCVNYTVQYARYINYKFETNIIGK